MGELTFFLGLQVQQKKDGIFISQDKYVGEILKKFGFTEVKTASTPIETQKPLLKDEDGEEVDVHMYRSMIGSLMYLTSSRPDIMFAVSACARYQVNPKVSHLHAVKRIFRRKTINREVQLQALIDGKKIIITESIVRRDLKLEDAEGVDCLPNATIFEQLTLMGYEKISQKLTFYKAFFSPQWKFLIHTILQCLSSKTTSWNEFSSTMASAIICLATNQKFNFLKYIFESMVKNLDNVGKFLMYPRFVHVFLDTQLEGMATHDRIYIAPSHTKKIFGNMKRVGKGFSSRVRPLFPSMVVHNQEEMGEGSVIPIDPHHTPTFIQLSPQPQKTQKPRRPKKKNTQVPQSSVPINNVADKAVYKEMDDSLERAATTATSLDAEQDSGNINKTQSKATLNEPSSIGTSSGSGPRRQETMGDIIAQTSLKLQELMALRTTLQTRVLDLETTKTTQGNEIDSMNRRVKKLERRNRSRTHKLKRLYKVGLTAKVESSGDEEDLGEDASKQGRRIHDIDEDDDITLVNVQNNADNEMFDADTLTTLKSAKPKVKGDVIEEPSVPVSVANASTMVSIATTTTATIPTPKKGIVIQEAGTTTTTTISSQQPSQEKVQDKDKGKMVEPEKPMKKKDQISFDEETAKRLQTEFDEEERLAREKDEANVALTKEWDDFQAKVEADY
ncbi:hypothetical protein Tco_0981663 [Tanacetum coccineum]